MTDRLNPGENTAAESDYQKKFNRDKRPGSDTNDLKQQEAAGGDGSWKTNTGKKNPVEEAPKKRRFGFKGGRAGKLRHASAFGFIIAMLLIGVWYTSVFAPNILLVNIKEMYTNDLADATVALNAYYWKMMNYKLGHSNCGDQQSIKCKLSTMSRAQKKAFEKAGFTVLGSKVTQDGRDTGQTDNPGTPESRYQVTAILPPNYKQTIDELKTSGLSWLTSGMSGNLNNLADRVSGDLLNIGKDQVQDASKNFLNYMPIATGDMLYLYSQLSDGNKSLVYSVFNPKSSFFMDARYRQVIKQRYGMSKSVTVSGQTEQQVNNAFDNSVKNSAGGIDTAGRPDPQNGISLGSLSNPVTGASILAAAEALSVNSNTYTQLECNWYSLGKAVTNDAKAAKAATIARFAMQYLKAADAIKAGQGEEVASNILSGKLAQATFGGYGGQNATDSSMYRAIVYGNLPIPSIYGFLYYLWAYEVIGAMMPSWFTFMASSAGLAGVTGAPGVLPMPPGDVAGGSRDYCLSGESVDNKTQIKGQSTNDTRCPEAITAMAPAGSAALVADAIEIARRTCPPTNASDDNLVHVLLGDWRGPIHNVMKPSVILTQQQLTPVIAALFGGNAITWANGESLLFTSQVKGVAASDALFAGTGQILGDMAMSRGMEPANIATMAIYMVEKQKAQKEFDDVARINAKQNPLDPYNKFSFLGSITHSLSPTYDNKSPLFSTLANAYSTLGSAVGRLNQSANAVYFLQPDPFNPARFSCLQPEYISIGITADTACNVRYALGKQEMAAQPDSVLDYMTKSHSDLTQKNIDELQQRLAKTAGDIEPGDRENVTRMLTEAQQGANSPQIDEHTGKAMPHTEYEKFQDYCVNRQDPWGSSAVAIHRSDLSNEQRQKKLHDKDGNGNAVSPYDSGDPYQQIPGLPHASITEGASADQDWYTGKKCLEQSEELMNFRAYTMMCSVDGTLSGGIDCTDVDQANRAAYSDNFYTSNNILYTSWY